MSIPVQLPAAIALGGALGAVSRHYVSGYVARLAGLGAPAGILAVNVAGSFLMGLLVGLLAFRIELPQAARAFLTVGFLGGFTTFSSFSLDAVTLIEQGHWGRAGLYVALSVILSIAGLSLGLVLARNLP